MNIKSLLLPVVFAAGTSLGLTPAANAGNDSYSLYFEGGDHNRYGFAYAHDHYRHGHRHSPCCYSHYPRHHRGHRYGHYKQPSGHYHKHNVHYRHHRGGHNGEERYRGNPGGGDRDPGHGRGHRGPSGR